MTKAVRWGVVGTGRIAQTFASDLAPLAEGEVVAVGSRTAEAAESFAARFSLARAHASYEALCEDPGVDCVYVATPHPFHRDHALLALSRGKPVLVEKAFTMTAGEARDVVAAARRAGLFAMEAMWTRFLPHVVALRERVAAGVLGEIVLVTADHGKWFAREATSRLFAPELGGGALLDLGVYPVSFASMLLGPPSSVRSMVTAAFTGVDATTSILLGHPSGAQAVLACTSSARSATRASVVGTEARLEIEGDFYAPSAFSLVARDGTLVERVEGPVVGRGLQFQAIEVARCLEAGLTESPTMPLDETVSIMATMDRVLAGADSG